MVNILPNDEREQERGAQRSERDHSRNLDAAASERGMFDGEGKMRRAVVRELTEPDVSDGAVEQLSNLLTKDFVLGNLSEAEVHEIKWMSRQMRLEIDDVHPHSRSVWQGEFGQFFFESNHALSSQEDLTQTQAEQLLLDISARAARGKEGFATKQLNTSINVSERRDDSDNSSSGGWL